MRTFTLSLLTAALAGSFAYAQSAPDFAVQGAMIYQSNQCGSCHPVNGVGMKIGPPLNGLNKRRTRNWVEQHFANPQALSPGSVMPRYKFTDSDKEKVVAYLFVLGECGPEPALLTPARPPNEFPPGAAPRPSSRGPSCGSAKRSTASTDAEIHRNKRNPSSSNSY